MLTSPRMDAAETNVDMDEQSALPETIDIDEPALKVRRLKGALRVVGVAQDRKGRPHHITSVVPNLGCEPEHKTQAMQVAARQVQRKLEQYMQVTK